MKAIKAILLIAVCTIALQASSRNAYLDYKVQQALSVKYTTSPAVEAAPTIIPLSAACPKDDCTKYKRKMIAGWVMFPVGVGAIIGGGYMMYTAAVNVTDRLNQSEDNVLVVTQYDKMMFAAGGAITLLGLVMAPTGLGLGIHATVKRQKHCGAGRSLYITPSGRYGAGFAMRF